MQDLDGCGDPSQCGIVTLDVEAIGGAEAVAKIAWDMGVAVSVSPPQSTLLDAERRSLPPLLRASAHYFNTVDDLERLCDVLHTASRGA